MRPDRHVWDGHRPHAAPLRLDGEVDGDAGAVVARLIYASNMSLDGCTEDERGAFDWAPPDDEVFAFITELDRLTDEHLGRAYPSGADD